MRVVVTGATGNIGLSVMRALSDDPTVEHTTGFARRLPALELPRCTFVAGDVRTADLDGLLRGADVLVQLAWAFQPTHDPLATWDVNVLGTMRAIEAAARAGVRAIVYASSVGAYSPGPGRTVDESWPTHSMPTAAYGREKAYLERVLDAFELSHPEVRVVRVRPCFVFQRAAASEQARVFATSLLPRGFARPGRLGLLPLPSGLRFQAVHAEDLAEAVRAFVTSDVRGAFNVAAGPPVDGTTLADLLDARLVPVPQGVARAAVGAAWRARLVRSDDRLLQLFLALPLLDTAKVQRELGWSPRHSGHDAVAELIEGIVSGAGAATDPLHRPHGRVTVG